MAIPAQTREAHDQCLWDSILHITKEAQKNNADPNAWASQVATTLHSAAVTVPSVEFAHRFVSHFFWENHSAVAWKLLDAAISFNIVPPLLLIALLSSRVVQRRKFHPAGYRLYLELLMLNAYSLQSLISSPNYVKIMESIDDVLQLSQVYSQKVCEPGVVLVEYVFSIVWQLLEASLDDEGLLDHAPENKPRWLSKSHDMNIDESDSFGEKNMHMELQRHNTETAIVIIAEFLQNKTTSRILCLVQQNMPSYWKSFIHHVQLLASSSSILKNIRLSTAVPILLLAERFHKVVSHECQKKSKMESNTVIPSGDDWSSLWLPIDLILEDALDGGQVAAFSSIGIIAGLVKTLHAVNGSTWHNTFLGLWIAALRLVQREKDPNEGPIPRLETCMCILLSITTLAVTQIIEEEECELIEEAERSPTDQGKERQALGKCRGELITCLQLLGGYECLLTPPKPVIMEANKAAAKAIMFLSGIPDGSGYLEDMTGNLRHLIVEACIAKNLLDASAYFWPGYVNACGNQIPRSISNNVAGWSSLMRGSQLTPSLVNVLVRTPASSLAEIEKIHEIATNGSDEQKLSAARILCGASLVCGWNVQEHTVLFITKLLSPPIPSNYSGTESHLIRQAPFLNTLLIGISSIDCVHIFSLHGLVPFLAAPLMQICEVFGSCVPDASWTLATGEKYSHWQVFSNAFALLLRFWRFDHLPVEQVRSFAATSPFGSPLSPEYLLLVRNRNLASFETSAKSRQKLKRWSKLLYFSFPVESVSMDSFPKLNFWYRQHQECIASSRSVLAPGRPVDQIVDALLSMTFRKVKKGTEGRSKKNKKNKGAEGSSSSSGSALDDATMKQKVPAWDILEAIPFVLHTALTACAYGRVSTRELATGLKDLADFFPASLVTIATYFSAEVTRGVWKPAFMNGTDWPSPTKKLSLVEQKIKNILAATGVDVPSLAVDGNSPATLPLPLAAFVSLSITYKLDKANERFLLLIGPAMNALASSCPWPCMPIVASLWILKARRWSDYFVLSASRTVFHHNRDAVVQLLKSCFTSTLGLGSASIHNNGGVSALLGHGFVSQTSDGISPVAPGILYLKVYHSIGDITFLTEEIVSILMLSVRDIAIRELTKGVEKKQQKTKYGIKNCVKQAALLGASLLWISGGQELVKSLIRETLPCWFLSSNTFEKDGGDSGATVAMLRGYALALLVILSSAFAWGIDQYPHAPNRRAKVVGLHLEFLANSLNRNTPLCCHFATWQAYVSHVVGLMVECTPLWIREVDVDLLKRLSRGLTRLNEHHLAICLLEVGGIGVMGAAAEMIVEFERRL